MSLPLDTYKAYRSYKINVCEIGEFHVRSIVESVHRKISQKQKFKNPWTVNVHGIIYKDIFYQLFRAIRDYSISYGRSVEVIRTKKGIATSYIITFTHFGALKFHLQKLANDKIDIATYFNRKWKNGAKGSIIVSVEKPAKLSYRVSTCTYHLNLHYKMENKYNELCSF